MPGRVRPSAVCIIGAKRRPVMVGTVINGFLLVLEKLRLHIQKNAWIIQAFLQACDSIRLLRVAAACLIRQLAWHGACLIRQYDAAYPVAAVLLYGAV